MKRQQGTETRTETRKGPHWWSSAEKFNYDVTTVNAYEVKNAIADCIESYNDSLPHYFNDQVRVLVRQVTNNVQKVWSESVASSEDSAAGFRNRVRTGVQSVIDKEYDLEYKGAQFSCSGTRLSGSAAEECIDQAKDFVSGLSRSFKSMLRAAIDDVYRKCRGCHFPKIVLDPYLRQLEDKKKCMEEPKLALENFARIKEEVAAIIE